MPRPSAPTRIRDVLWRGGLRVAYSLQRLYWFVFRPEQRGVYVAVWHRGRLLVVKLSYRSAATIPCGAVKRGEPRASAAARELAEEVGIDVRPEALRFVGEVVNHSGYLKDHCDVFELDLSEEPAVRVDRREVVRAAFRTPAEILAGPLSPVVRAYLTELPAGRARAASD
ncbi:MAG: NUDIX hydrolase [Deltaproteobacteria bacterium]|nr:MAG: NUDIX hydrolase [Deltaproteobacteria bacterium]